MSSQFIAVTKENKLGYFLLMEKSILFERAFTLLLTEEVEKKRLTHAEFGRMVFGEEIGARAWRKVRHDNKPRKMSIAEAYKAAEVLGKDYPALVWEIEKEAEKRGLLTPST